MPFTHHLVRRGLAALLPAAAVAFATTAVLPAGAATVPRASLPDLVITMIVVRELPGTPPYIAIDEATRAPGFVVKVVTKNIGDATAGGSVTDLKLQEQGETLWASGHRRQADAGHVPDVHFRRG
jgi:hypothetical protein